MRRQGLVDCCSLVGANAFQRFFVNDHGSRHEITQPFALAAYKDTNQSNSVHRWHQSTSRNAFRTIASYAPMGRPSSLITRICA